MPAEVKYDWAPWGTRTPKTCGHNVAKKVAISGVVI